MRVLRPIAAVMVVSAALSLANSFPAKGAAPAADPPSPSSGETMTLVSQTTWVTDRSAFEMRVALSGGAPLAALDVTVSVYGALQTRSGFTATQQGRALGVQRWSESGGVDQLAPNGGAVPICVPVDAGPPPDCKAGAPLYLNGVPGVYPVSVTLQNRDTGTTLARLVTHLVLLGPPAAAPLRVALVQPVTAGEALLPTGARSVTAAGIAHLGDVESVLSPAVTAAIDPATLAAVADTPTASGRDLLAGLRRALSGAFMPASPFAAFSPYDMESAGLTGEMATQLQRGGEIAQAQLGIKPSTGTWILDGPVDRSTLDALTALGVTRLVVPPDDVEAGFTRLTPSQPYRLDAGGATVPALVEDANLAADLGLPDPVLGAHELLADLAQTYFEAPNATRGVVVVAPRQWPANRAAADVVSGGLATSPVLAASALDQVFSGVPTAATRAMAALPGRRPALPAARIRADRSNQAALAGSVTASLPAIGSMNDLILESEADGLDNARRAAFLGGAEHVLAAQLGLVSLVHSSITLTARQATVPVSVQSLLPVPIAVRLTVSSDQLQFPGGGTSDTLPVQTLDHQNTTFNVPVTTRGVGSFPLRVTIVTANGALLISGSRLTINSRAFSGVGIGLSFGALAFLALWWGRELRRGRGRKRAAEPA